MIRILAHGCMGKMCTATCKAIAGRQEKDMAVVAGVDVVPGTKEFPTYTSLSDVKEEFDLIIDYSVPEAVRGLCNYANAKNKALIVFTTGLKEEHYDILQRTGRYIPVFNTYNAHLGMFCLLEVVKETLKYFGDWDIELVDQHHKNKLDAPSGTAEKLMELIKDAKPDAEFIYDRSTLNRKRRDTDVGVMSIRAGSMVGYHHLTFGTDDEQFEIKHTVVTRNVLSNGAMKIIGWMSAQPAGFYNMDYYISQMKNK